MVLYKRKANGPHGSRDDRITSRSSGSSTRTAALAPTAPLAVPPSQEPVDPFSARADLTVGYRVCSGVSSVRGPVRHWARADALPAGLKRQRFGIWFLWASRPPLLPRSANLARSFTTRVEPDLRLEATSG